MLGLVRFPAPHQRPPRPSHLFSISLVALLALAWVTIPAKADVVVTEISSPYNATVAVVGGGAPKVLVVPKIEIRDYDSLLNAAKLLWTRRSIRVTSKNAGGILFRNKPGEVKLYQPSGGVCVGGRGSVGGEVIRTAEEEGGEGDGRITCRALMAEDDYALGLLNNLIPTPPKDAVEFKAKFTPFSVGCICLASPDKALDYRVEIVEEEVSWQPFLVGGGLLLWILAPYLAGSMLCHVAAGGAVGSTLAAIAVMYIFYKFFMPKNAAARTAVVLFPSLVLTTVCNLVGAHTVAQFLKQHPWIVYVLAAGAVVSGVWVYLHPLSERAQNVTNFFLRAAALVALMNSTQSWYVNIGLAALPPLWSWILFPVLRRIGCCWVCGGVSGGGRGKQYCERVRPEDYDELTRRTTNAELAKLRGVMRKRADEFMPRLKEPMKWAEWSGAQPNVGWMNKDQRRWKDWREEQKIIEEDLARMDAEKE